MEYLDKHGLATLVELIESNYQQKNTNLSQLITLASGGTFGFFKKTGTNAWALDSDVASGTALTTHTSATNNPHSVTKAQVGLGNVENHLSLRVDDASQGLTATQKSNGRTNLGLGSVATHNIYNASTSSTGDIPVLDSSKKLDLGIIPDSIVGQMCYGGVITARSGDYLVLSPSPTFIDKFSRLHPTWTFSSDDTYKLANAKTSTNPSAGSFVIGWQDAEACYFIANVDITGSSSWAGMNNILRGDWIVTITPATSTSTGWSKVDNTDAITEIILQKTGSADAVKTGAVYISCADLGAFDIFATGTQTVKSSILPNTNATLALGSGTYNWSIVHTREMRSNDDAKINAANGKKVILQINGSDKAQLDSFGNFSVLAGGVAAMGIADLQISGGGGGSTFSLYTDWSDGQPESGILALDARLGYGLHTDVESLKDTVDNPSTGLSVVVAGHTESIASLLSASHSHTNKSLLDHYAAAGDSTHPIYIAANGTPTQISKVAAASTADAVANALSFGNKTYDGSAAKTIVISDVGTPITTSWIQNNCVIAL